MPVCNFFSIFGKLEGIDKFSDVAIQHIPQIVNRQSYAVIGYPPLRKIISPDLSTTVTRAYKTFTVPGYFLLLLSYLLFGKAWVLSICMAFSRLPNWDLPSGK